MSNTRFHEELGKAVADRLGLNHNTTGMEWSAEGAARGDSVMVKMTTFKMLSQAEYNELIAVALNRAASLECEGKQ